MHRNSYAPHHPHIINMFRRYFLYRYRRMGKCQFLKKGREAIMSDKYISICAVIAALCIFFILGYDIWQSPQ